MLHVTSQVLNSNNNTVKYHETPLLAVEPLHHSFSLPRSLRRVRDHGISTDADAAT